MSYSMEEITQGRAEMRHRLFHAGMRVRAVGFATSNSSVDDNCTVPPGTGGTVRYVDSLGTVHVAWDNGAHLGVLVEDGLELA